MKSSGTLTNNMPTRNFHFQRLGDNWVLREYRRDITLGETVASWPTGGYTRDKALNRSHRHVGEQVLRADPDTTFNYTQENPETPIRSNNPTRPVPNSELELIDYL